MLQYSHYQVRWEVYFDILYFMYSLKKKCISPLGRDQIQSDLFFIYLWNVKFCVINTERQLSTASSSIYILCTAELLHDFYLVVCIVQYKHIKHSLQSLLF